MASSSKEAELRSSFDPNWPHGHIFHNSYSSRPARLLASNLKGDMVYVFAVDYGNYEGIATTDTHGKNAAGYVANNPAPLVKKSGWINIFISTVDRVPHTYAGVGIFPTEAEAKRFGTSCTWRKYLTSTEIHWREPA